MDATRETLLAEFQRATDDVLGEDAPTLTTESALGDGEIDSLDLVEIVMVIEERFSIAFDPTDFDNVRNVNGAIDVIMAKLDA